MSSNNYRQQLRQIQINSGINPELEVTKEKVKRVTKMLERDLSKVKVSKENLESIGRLVKVAFEDSSMYLKALYLEPPTEDYFPYPNTMVLSVTALGLQEESSDSFYGLTVMISGNVLIGFISEALFYKNI